MPIYEYTCKDCGSDFELLIRGEEKPVCPSCGKTHLTKSFSVPAAHSGQRDQGTSLPPRAAVWTSAAAACAEWGINPLWVPNYPPASKRCSIHLQRKSRYNDGMQFLYWIIEKREE